MSDPTPRLNAALECRYAIERELGEGGMATVYLADDLKHERKVALKVLKPELAAVVGAERFLAEIKTTANLQHPHILPLFDSGEADGFLYYVMPFVEGETLRNRIDREGQLPVDEAVGIARAVADALHYAHRQDVIHRDIKPENIMLHEGNPVVADFGIALAVQQAGGGRLTETGLSLGTPYYMSPEQATADRDPGPRSDVYSLASVLYEMLTGEPPHSGTSAQAILGKILTADPVRPTELRRSVPAHVEAVILRCLEKLPADRLSSAAEFGEALAKPGTVELGGYGATLPDPKRPAGWLPWTVTAAAVAAVAVTLFGRTGLSPELEAVTVRAVLELPANVQIEFPHLSITPDGQRLLVHGSVDGRHSLLVRDLDDLEFRPLAETEGASDPFISYDGRWVGYRSGDGLRKAPVAGGPSVLLDAESQWGAGHWTASDTIYYSRNYRSGIWRIPAEGGEPEMLTTPDDERGDLAHWWPQLLPDGEHVLFTVFRTPIDRAEIAVLALVTGEQKVLLTGGVHARYLATGHLIYAREEALLAVPFDLDRMEVTGNPVTVVDDVAMIHVDGLAGYTVSETGTLVYLPASDFRAPADLVFVGRDGSETQILPEPGIYTDPALSPDGRQIALSIREPGEPGDIFVLDLARGTRSRITAGGGDDFAPRWTPDGNRVIYAVESPVFDLYIRPADASSPASALVTGPFDNYPVSFTPDGQSLIYTQSALPRSRAMSVPLGGGAPDTVFAPAFQVTDATLSPDGRWLAYTATESGRAEVFLSSYPDPSLRRQLVSSEGGLTPLWTRGGREIVYRSGDQVIAVAVDPATGDLGRPEVLFEGPYLYSRGETSVGYDVSADGERFVLVKRPLERAPRRLIVVTNWFEELKELVPN